MMRPANTSYIALSHSIKVRPRSKYMHTTRVLLIPNKLSVSTWLLPSNHLNLLSKFRFVSSRAECHPGHPSTASFEGMWPSITGTFSALDLRSTYTWLFLTLFFPPLFFLSAFSITNLPWCDLPFPPRVLLTYSSNVIL